MSDLIINPDYYRELFSRWTKNTEMLPDFPLEVGERLVALHFVMMAFKEGVDYSEEDINEGIRDRNLFSTDHVQIRLNLIHHGFLNQIKEGRETSYRSSKSFLDQANWDPSIPGAS